MSLSKIPLSNSTHGRGIKVTQTAIATGDSIHTAEATTTDGLGDDITLFAFNSDTVNRILTIGFGGVTDPDDLIKVTIPPGEYMAVLAGLLLRNGLVVKAAADAANKVIITGYVIRSA